MEEITKILEKRKLNGDPDDALIAAVYAQLKLMAKNRMAGERRGHTLQATALVHEAWLRIGDQYFENRNNQFRSYLQTYKYHLTGELVPHY